jgi:hypothetical protein
MAGEIQRRVQRFPWASPSGQAIGPAGVTADEVKINQGVQVARPEHAPIAQRGPVEFITPSTSSETLRLAVPTAANPYATPTGPRHDHMMVRQALGRSNTDTSKQLMGILRDPPSGIDKSRVEQMRASLSREHAMLGLLRNLQEMQEMIYGRIIGSQSG